MSYRLDLTYVAGFNIENCPGSLQIACNVCVGKLKPFVNSLNCYKNDLDRGINRMPTA